MTDTVKAAGICFIAKDGQTLFLKRGPGSDYAGAWCFPGGHTEDGETALDTAQRETVEEIGHMPEGTQSFLTRSITEYTPSISQDPAEPITPLPPKTVDFTTFLQRVEDRFDPAIDGEHVGFAWAPADQPPEPLHPGCRIALERLSMDELGVARAMSEGRLTSPQQYMNVTLFDIRITGTGMAYRSARKQFAWRDPSVYLNPDFLARCNGLSVIYEHPEKSTLTSNEYNNRNVGSVMLPYIKGDDVWGIAKLYDESAIALMRDGKLSTSPCVLTDDSDESDILYLSDGTPFLKEGRPILLDHIAICEQGVWDKGDEPAGVINNDIGDLTMTEEEKAKADAQAKADAETGTKLDKLLSGIDAMTAKLDSYCAKVDSMEAKSEADEKAKADAELDEEGKAAKLAADAAKKDADEKEEADEKAKADAAALKADSDEIKAKLADMETKLPMSLTDADYDAMSDTQAKADAVHSLLGSRAPRPLQGENPLSYRKRLANGLKPHSTAWSGIDLSALPDAAFSIAETSIYADAEKVGRNPAAVPDGELRMITRELPSGHREHTFVGKPSAWMGSFAASRSYVTGITVPGKGN